MGHLLETTELAGATYSTKQQRWGDKQASVNAENAASELGLKAAVQVQEGAHCSL